MTNYKSDQYTNVTATPPVELRADEWGGRVRSIFWYYLTDASAAPVAGDILFLARLPANARVTSMEVMVPASFVTSSAKIGYGTVDAAGTYTAGDDDRWGAAIDLSTVGRKQFLTVPADVNYRTTTEVVVALTFTTGDPAEAKQIGGLIQYVID